MSYTSVFRLEDENNSGIYNGGYWESHIGPTTASGDHPMPWNDSDFVENEEKKFNNIQRSAMLFGFRSIQQYNRWMYNDTWKRKLEAAGIVLNEYKVDYRYIVIGRTQCTFDHDRAKLVKTHRPTDF